MITGDEITDAQIWQVAALALEERNDLLLNYCAAALCGGRRRSKSGRAHCAAVLNAYNARVVK